MPRELLFVPPMDCKSVESLPEDHDWQSEIKFDGYRAIALKQHGNVQVYAGYAGWTVAPDGTSHRLFAIDQRHFPASAKCRAPD
jgi:hypothetical protein